jgi:membrane protease YdiL (CAAX protease family)
VAIIDLKALEQSPFLADVGDKERRIGRLLLGVLAGIVGAIVIAVMLVVIYMLVRVAAGVPIEEAMTTLQRLVDPNQPPTMTTVLWIMGLLAVGNGLTFGGFTVIAALIQQIRIKSLFTAASRFRWRLLALGMVMFVLVIGPVLVVDTILSGTTAELPLLKLAHTLPERVIYVLVGLVALIIAAGVEELMCRGWLMRQTAAWSRNFWVLVIVNFLVFSALHVPDVDINNFIGRGLMAGGFCYMALRTGGIEFSTGAHAANNLLLLLFVQATPIAHPPPQPFSLTSALTTLAAVLGYVLITEIVVRWTPLRQWSQALVEREPESAAVFA